MNHLYTRVTQQPCLGGDSRVPRSNRKISSKSSDSGKFETCQACSNKRRRCPAVHRLTVTDESQSPPSPVPQIQRVHQQTLDMPFLQREITRIDSADITFRDSDTNTLLAQLGRGLYGCVYMGKLNNKRVAVKVFNANYRKDCVGWEYKIMAFVEPTGVTPKVFGMSQVKVPLDEMYADQRMALVMEYIEGVSLHTFLKTDEIVNSLEPYQWLRLARNVAETVQKLHAANIIHNDIKIQNIIVMNDRSTVRLVDFGSAAYEKGNVYQIPQSYWKNFKHYAPEVLDGACTEFSSDIYSLGVVLQKIYLQSNLTDTALFKLSNACCAKVTVDRPQAAFVCASLTEEMKKFKSDPDETEPSSHRLVDVG